MIKSMLRSRGEWGNISDVSGRRVRHCKSKLNNRKNLKTKNRWGSFVTEGNNHVQIETKNTKVFTTFHQIHQTTRFHIITRFTSITRITRFTKITRIFRFTRFITFTGFICAKNSLLLTIAPKTVPLKKLTKTQQGSFHTKFSIFFYCAVAKMKHWGDANCPFLQHQIFSPPAIESSNF